jgi:hypothetical protein
MDNGDIDLPKRILSSPIKLKLQSKDDQIARLKMIQQLKDTPTM